MIEIKNTTSNDQEHKTIIKVEFDKEAVQNAIDKVEKELAKNVEIKGFRKGKAPISEARKYLNSNEVNERASRILFDEGFDKIIDKYFDDNGKERVKDSINFFIQSPDIKVQKYSNEVAEVDYLFDNYPTVSVDVNDIKIKATLKKPTNDEIQKLIDRELEKNSTSEVIEDKDATLQKGEIAVFDFVGTIDGKEFEGGSAKSYELEIGSNRFIEGFEDQMVGMKVNETKDINVKFPDNYQAQNLAGKDATFKVTLLNIKKIVRPQYNDEFIKSLGYENVSNDAELRKYLFDKKQKDYEENYKNVVQRDISEELIRITKISNVPQFLVDQQYQRIYDNFKQMLDQYKIKMDEYVKISGKSEQEVTDGFKKEAHDTVVLDFAVAEVAKKENWIPSEKEVDDEIERIGKMYDVDKHPEIKERLLENKPLVKAQLEQKLVFENLSKKYLEQAK